MLGLEEIIGLEAISSDARVVGTVEGVGIDTSQWKIVALKIGLRRGLEESLGRRKHVFTVEKMLLSTEAVDTVSDTVILRTPVSAVGEADRHDDGSLTTAGGLMGMRVILRNARSLGMVDNLFFDPDNGWTIPFLQVKLDREAVASLNLKHQFLGAPLTVVRTSDIRAMGDMIMLGVTMEELQSTMERGRPTIGPEAQAVNAELPR